MQISVHLTAGRDNFTSASVTISLQRMLESGCKRSDPTVVMLVKASTQTPRRK